MRNHFHLVLETPNGNLVAGMRWFLNTYTLRFNPRRKRFGHVFSGWYKALLVDGSGNDYLKTVCDYVQLNPVRANWLRQEQRLLEYPWSSFGGYLAAQAYRPAWLRVDRLLRRHGIQEDTGAGRALFELRMEPRRVEPNLGAEWQPIRRGWCLGPPEFKSKLLEQRDGKLGKHHSGELNRESSEAKAERIIRAELKNLGWSEADLTQGLKSDPSNRVLADRLRRETTLNLPWIKIRLQRGTWKSLNSSLYRWRKVNRNSNNESRL